MTMRHWGLALGLGVVSMGSAWSLPHPSVSAPVVLIIGGSAAFGWHDVTGQGFVVRGLKAWSRYGQPLYFQNRAVPGATVHNPIIAQGYESWLELFHPTIVALQWGMLNDLRLGTPKPEILGTIRQEILEALAQRSVVLVITPPATDASYGVDKTSEPKIVDRELRMAEGLHNPNVYTLNVFTVERQWLQSHHLSVAAFMDGPWDPNTRGHILAGSLLAGLLKKTLPRGRVRFADDGQFRPGVWYFEASVRKQP